ncbi:sensor histidine kinase [Rhizobium halophytocola]|uniref:histidine kinase n=1 Tax=Rhizobium halophytocola TaxID=735519 RepID=A0ABS4DUU1_9HYPH|nr:ATP-binding protein [Rhizobium halophytocola]MBP1849468.1 signal transduction histidine kinase [Rhizobium halophytocola]
MRSFTLASRLSAIVIVSVIAVWLGVVMNFYAGNGWEQDDGWPTPDRMDAIISVVERAAPEDLPRLFDALGSQTMIIGIEDGGENADPDQTDRQVSEELHRRYAEGLAGRAFTVAHITVPARGPGILRVGNKQRHALNFRIGLEDGRTLVVQSIAPLVLAATGLPVGLVAGVMAAIIALFALFVMYREVKPLRQLAQAVDRIGLDGEMVTLPNVRRQSSEIRALVTAFDRLQTRLQQLLQGRLAMLGGISHDVRTYATRLRLRVDAIPDDIQRERAIENISDMIQLLDDALLSARVGASDVSVELLDFAEIVRGEAEDRHAAPQDLGLAIQKRTEFSVLGDRIALKRIVSNLIDNAGKYGKAARISLTASDGDVLMTVDDDGPGIPQEMIGILMEPFVRAEASRGRATGGAGLGLAIVRTLVEAHGGTVTIENRPEGGLRVSVRLPRFEG